MTPESLASKKVLNYRILVADVKSIVGGTAVELRDLLALIHFLVQIAIVLALAWGSLLAMSAILLTFHRIRAYEKRRFNVPASANMRNRVAETLMGMLSSPQRIAKSFAPFIISVVFALLTTAGTNLWARQYLRDFIARNDDNLVVTVQGQRLQAPRPYLDFLSSIHMRLEPKGSHPTGRISIQLAAPDGEQVDLALGEDSRRPNEYWVYFPMFTGSKTQAIGRVHTDIFHKR